MNFDLAGSATVLAPGFVRSHSTPELTPLSSHLIVDLARQEVSLATCLPTSARCFWLALPAVSTRPCAIPTLRASATGTAPADHARFRRDRCIGSLPSRWMLRPNSPVPPPGVKEFPSSGTGKGDPLQAGRIAAPPG